VPNDSSTYVAPPPATTAQDAGTALMNAAIDQLSGLRLAAGDRQYSRLSTR